MARTLPSTTLLDYTADKVAVLDEEGRFRYLNDPTTDILGYEPEALLGESVFEYIHPQDREMVRERFEEIIGQPGHAEGTVTYRHRSSEGSWVWLESRMSNATDGALDGYVVSSRDVTDRVIAEQRLEDITTVTDEVLWMFTGDWSELLYCNPAVEEIYGVSVDELEGDPTTFLSCVHPADVTAVREAMAQLSAGKPLELEYRVNADAEYDRWVWVRGRPLLDDDGDVIRIVGFTREVTDRKRRERQLLVMDNLLRHNVRNNLNVVLGNLELIEGHITPDVADRTAVIRSAAQDLLDSAEKQRDIIRLLQGPPTRHRIPLSTRVGEVADRLRERFPDCTIETEIEPNCWVHGLDELGAAVTELIENSLDHATDDAPSVTVRVERTDGHVRVSVSDRAPAIPEAEYEYLTRGEEMTAVYHTTGLGLWLVYWVVELSDGDLSVERREGGGNRVRLTLAAADEPA